MFESTKGHMKSTVMDEGYPIVRGIGEMMQTIERTAADIAPTDIPVLLVGEVGAGKEVLARYIHQLSPWRDKGLFKVSCGVLSPKSLPDYLFQSDGTSAANGGKGAGTLVFDEVSELDEAGQRWLFSTLPDGDVMPRTRSLSARIISIASGNLEERLGADRFRSELYYRLNGVCIQLPPLRQRKEDIPVLVDFFLVKYAKRFERPLLSLSQETLDRLFEYSWPGNIRELENVVKKMVALGNEHIPIVDTVAGQRKHETAPAERVGASLKAVARAASRQAERKLILNSLEQTHWNRKRAARELQISYKSLLYKLNQIRADESKKT